MSKETLDEYVTANPDRFKMIHAAIMKITEDKKPVTLAALQAELPKDFQLAFNLDHVAEIVALENGVVTMDVKEAADNIVTLADHAVADLSVTVTETPEAVIARVAALTEKCHGLRGQIATLATQRTRTRAKLADAICEYQKQTGPRITPLDNTRAFLKSSSAERAEQKRHGREPVTNTHPRSIVDRQALYSHGSSGTHDASDHVRAQFQNGGFRRGSHPASRKNAPTRFPNSGQ